MRTDNRKADETRTVKITTGFISSADGSVLIEMGNTRVICNATLLPEVPAWLAGKGRGWITAEYSLLPQSTGKRVERERKGASGRTQEIQRLIGRSLRGAADLNLLGENAIVVDCDVIQADGGTRTASITGGYVALVLAIDKLMRQKLIEKSPIVEQVAAISLGKVKGELLLDLDFVEDSSADIDANLVSTPQGNVIEWQTTAERALLPFSELGAMVELGLSGIRQLCEVQNAAIEAHRAAMAHETPRT